MTNITNIDRTPYVNPPSVGMRNPFVEIPDDPCDEAGAPFWQDVPQGRSPVIIRVETVPPSPAAIFAGVVFYAGVGVLLGLCFASMVL